MNRRDFLKLLIASSLLGGCGIGEKRIGLALGGGGARGLAHIPMLEVLDELGVRPDIIAGTSIGAVIGALYASGMSGSEIRQLVDRLTVSADESWLSSLFNEEVGRWWNFIELRLGQGGLVDTKAFATFLQETIKVSQFGDLQIPLRVVTTDFWERRQIVFSHGSLIPAIQGSMAIPGLFNPVQYRGHVLVDGGMVNPVPYDILQGECDLVIAIDVIGNRKPKSDNGPGYFETIFNTMTIMQAVILQEKLKASRPHIYIRPELDDIRVLDFNRVEEIYTQALPARNRLNRALRGLPF